MKLLGEVSGRTDHQFGRKLPFLRKIDEKLRQSGRENPENHRDEQIRKLFMESKRQKYETFGPSFRLYGPLF